MAGFRILFSSGCEAGDRGGRKGERAAGEEQEVMRQDRWVSPLTALLWSERQQGSSAQMKDTDSGDQSSCLSNPSLLHF